MNGIPFLKTEKLNYCQRNSSPEIGSYLKDLSNPDTLKQLSVFNSILINHFIPDNKVLVSLQNNLESGGILMIVAFDERMTAIRAVPHDYILDFNSLELHLSMMSLIKKEEFRDERGFFRAAVFNKK